MHPPVAIVPLLVAVAGVQAPAASAEEFCASLQTPLSLEDIAVEVAKNELEIDYDLREVGRVSLGAHAEDDGSGRGLVTVRGIVVAEVEFVGDAVAWEESDFAGLSPEQAQAVAASLVQVWHDDVVMAALLNSRDLKCWWVGKIAGSTLGVAVFSGCGLATKSPSCYGHGLSVGLGVAKYITDKCNGAQNK